MSSSATPDAPPDGDPRRFVRRLREHRFGDRSTAGDEPEPVVTRARLVVGDRRRQELERRPPRASGVGELVDHARELLVEDLADPREQVVRLVELRNALALPLAPRVARVGWGRRRVAFEHGDVVAVLGQHHRRRQADDAAAAHHDRCHDRLLVANRAGDPTIPAVLDHVSIQCADVAASAAFYDTVLATLGGGRVMDFGEVLGYGVDGRPDVLARSAHHR